MTSKLKQKLNQFISDNKTDRELMNLFKTLVKLNADLFKIDEIPVADWTEARFELLKTGTEGANLPPRTQGFLDFKLKEIAKFKAQPIQRVRSVLSFVYENQMRGLYDISVPNELRRTEAELEQREQEVLVWKQVRKTYNDIPKYMAFDYSNYFGESIRLLDEWEATENYEDVEKNLFKLRNSHYQDLTSSW